MNWTNKDWLVVCVKLNVTDIIDNNPTLAEIINNIINNINKQY